MNAERWDAIARICERALELDPAARAAFLDRACGDDRGMREDVDALIAQDQASGIIDRPMWSAAAQLLDEQASLAPGTVLGPYQIDRLIGEGGMGQVFHATDSRLNRSVAIKVLPPSVNIDRQLRDRFDREAQAGASLTHPHICTLYDVGSHDGMDFIVMEYLAGETLAARLSKGPLPLDRAIRHAIELAGALDHAHRAGIVHRDVKPANVMLTAGGAKLMDFGVAKLRPATAEAARSTSLTGHGTIVGTVRYMSPEQVEGRETDHRSDIFSLGVVIYEMVTGRPPFDGGSSAGIMAAILEREPPAMNALQQLTPPALDHVVGRCLAKPVDERWQSAGDVMRELQWVAEGAGGAAVNAPGAGGQPGSRLGRVTRLAVSWPALAGVLAVALLALLVRASPWRREAPPTPVRFGISAPITRPLAAGVGSERRVMVSPDGSAVVYVAALGSTRRPLMIHRFSQLQPQELRGTTNARAPFFSPDGKWVGFYDPGSRELRKVPVEGGSATTVSRVDAPVNGASWGTDDIIVFSAGLQGGLQTVPARGGEPAVLTTPDASRKEATHQFPVVLPGARAVLFTIRAAEGDAARIAALDRRSGQWRVLLEGNGPAEYIDTGHLLYVYGRTLHAVGFDADSLELSGRSMPLVDDVGVARGTQGAAQYGISRSGTLIYVPASSVRFSPTSLYWVDRTGREESVDIPHRPYYALRLSPDGTRVALDVREGQFDTWVYDLVRRTLEKVTSHPRNDVFPIWSPDGQRVVTGDGPGIIWRAANGGGNEDALTTPSAEIHFPMAFSPDGRFLLLTEVRGAHNDLSILPMEGTRDGKPLPLLQSPANEGPADISPDGGWIAYQSNESGENQIYVRPFPDVTRARWLISPDGGSFPAWSRDGRELFYIDAAGFLTAVPVQARPHFQTGSVTRLFDASKYTSSTQSRSYDISPDGRRFLFIREQSAAPGPNIVIVLNWIDEVRARLQGN